MSKRKFYMHKTYQDMMRITPSSDTEGRHSEGKKPYSFKRVSYKQMEDLNFRDLTRRRGGASKVSNPCSGHRSLDVSFSSLTLDAPAGLQLVSLNISDDFVSPVISADGVGLTTTNGVPISSTSFDSASTGEVKLLFNNPDFPSSILCVTVCDSECGGCSITCAFVKTVSECEGCNCDGEDDCVEDCCVTGGEGEEIEEGGELQLNCGAGGVWSVEGSGVSVDQTGLVSATEEACGVATVSNTKCVTPTVLRVTGGNSGWHSATIICEQAGSLEYSCTVVSGDTQYFYQGICVSPGACTVPNGHLCGAAPCVGGCGSDTLCNKKVTRSTWECN